MPVNRNDFLAQRQLRRRPGDVEVRGDRGGAALLPAPPDAVELAPAADIAANQLPDVVVDDIVVGNKVNLRNIAPADTPILLWMYAPH